MTKDRHNELDWFDQLERDVNTQLAKSLLAARHRSQATRVATTRFQRLLGALKRFLGLSK